MKHLEIIKNKILSSEELCSIMEVKQSEGKTFAFSNGCFDLVHQGHIDYLSKSRDLADYLVIGLNTDSSVRRLKGPRRPINDQYSRALMLASFLFIDYVVMFDEDTPYNLIKTLHPDVLIKGSDYKVEDIVGYDIVTERGGKVVTLDFIPGFSTTLIEKRIREE